MKKYGVTLPLVGHIYLEVEAENKKEALEKALETQWKDENIVDLEAIERVVEGNVVYMYGTCADVTEVKE